MQNRSMGAMALNIVGVLKPVSAELKRTFVFFFACFLLLCSANVFALDIRRETLPNGLKVVHVERHSLPIVMATLLVEASPLDEPADKAGIAYLTAKMLSEGSATKTANEISETMDFVGGSLEASTSSDFTTISLSVLKKDSEAGFELLSDILLSPTFPEVRLKKQKDLVKGALRRNEDDPAFVASKTFLREVFGNAPYGRLITGSMETIDRIQRDDVVSFYREYYSPGKASLVVVGDITPEELRALLQKQLGRWKSEGMPKARTGMSEGESGRKLFTINKEISQANIVMGHRGVARGNPDYYAVSVMNYIFGGGGFSSRLMKVIRDDMGLTYNISSSFSPTKEPGPFEIEVQTRNESAKTVIEETIKQINTMRTTPVSDQELSDAKAYLTGSFPRRLETSRRVADFLSAVGFYGLGDDYITRYPEYINRVTKDDVLRVAQKYLQPENLKIVVVGNKEKTGLSDPKSLEDINQLRH
ncbi:MAG: insulinase family protein [Nitrospirales bacterium]|nr:insulinase family protein [Nitrospirales bacterium]